MFVRFKTAFFLHSLLVKDKIHELPDGTPVPDGSEIVDEDGNVLSVVGEKVEEKPVKAAKAADAS